MKNPPSNAFQLPSASPLAAHWTLDPKIAYLNHGAFGACPRALQEKQTEYRAQMEAEPTRFLQRELPDLLDDSRSQLAKLVNASPADLAFVHNATSGVNAVARSLEFQPGDEILTTNHYYKACFNTLTEVARRSGARVVVAEIPFPFSEPEEIVEAILRCVTPRTRLAMIDHVTSPTWLFFPLRKSSARWKNAASIRSSMARTRRECC